MRIKLQVQIKEGRPNYGSAGAGAEVEFEVPDQVAGTGEFQALVEGRYGLLQREVERQLCRMGTAPQTQQTQQPEIRPERPAAGPQRRDDRAPIERNGAGGYQDRVPLGPGPRPTAQPGPQRDDPPQTGGQLLGWAYNHSCGEELKSLAKAWQIPGPIKGWSRDDVIAAYNELSRARPQWGGH